MFNPDDIKDLQYSTEKQIIDRKSARISARDFTIPVVAMANADGGYIREYTSLKEGAVFKTIPEYPEFCWTELIVNAVAHRDYSIKGTDIQIKMFDDHLCLESPGILPWMVRIDNIREFHFSRNPKIVELLNEYDLVKEFGEGVDRVYRDMKDAGLPEPCYKQSEYMLYAELRNKTWGHIQDTPQDTPKIL